MNKYIKRINKKTVETFLGVKIIPNITAIGFDSSEHSTGIAIIRTTSSYVIIEKTCKITVPQEITKLDAIDLFTEQIDSLKNSLQGKYKFDINIIENCYVGFNPQTAIWLARVGILVYDRFKRLSKVSGLKYPTSARKLIKFKKTSKKIKGKKLKQELINYINLALNLKITDTDIADALILALSGIIDNEN